jgi:hypothetical protein
MLLLPLDGYHCAVLHGHVHASIICYRFTELLDHSIRVNPVQPRINSAVCNNTHLSYCSLIMQWGSHLTRSRGNIKL